MLHISRNEYETTLRAAFTAAGLVRGEAIDATRTAVWLEATHGRLHLFLPRILDRLRSERLLRPIAFSEGFGATWLDARGASVLALGTTIADVALAEKRLKGLSCISVHNLADIDLAEALERCLWARGEAGRIAVEVGADNTGTLRLEFTARPYHAGRGQVRTIGGFDVEPGAWAEIVTMASRMLVPESDVSRIEGAGLGADED